MATRFIFLSFCLLFSSTLTISNAKIFPTFPSSRITPEKLSSLISNSKDSQGLYKTKYHTQILDHFNYNPQSYQTFQQRYLINDTHWGGSKNNAPIFVYTGNEGDIEWFAQNTGFMYDVAPKFKALLVFIEHRYYGKSIPYGGNKEIAYKNASTTGYLSSTQALADYASLIIDLKKNLTATDSPVVVFGGSYGGMLAAWFRLKYPHVAIGALASSAPILNFDNIVSPYSFSNIITQDFRSVSENCYKVIKGSWKQIEETAKKPGGLEKLQKAFRISIDDPKTGNDVFAKLYGAASVYYNYSGTAKCFDLNGDSDPHGLSEWGWQACTEMIMLTGGDNKDSIFEESEEDYDARARYCKEAYGVDPRPNWITTEFGGHKIGLVLKRFASNIIFFNGLRDPWSGGGVLKNISKTVLALVEKEGAHHVDLRFSTKEDPQWLKDVRRREVEIVGKWISQYFQDLAQ
ncbi:alpha/beta-Hydrolases superfamily protein [Citrus sinensis]|uniref:Alpha/beta-Hydrolases superfamily protein n=1 Tax=Citrus sinensis TaxID=2711 RepID=A0ACB8JZ66_CITSI|nr:alpha/beta-Hydrolases superfamily protein [Citrus sinensis]